MDFPQALAEHLAAIQNRDLDAFLATVHADASVILPTGTLLSGRDAIADFHKDFFGDPDWSMKTEAVRVETIGDTAFAVLSVIYDDLDADGVPYRKNYYLTLYFAREGGRWLLVHDQNTFC